VADLWTYCPIHGSAPPRRLRATRPVGKNRRRSTGNRTITTTPGDATSKLDRAPAATSPASTGKADERVPCRRRPATAMAWRLLIRSTQCCLCPKTRPTRGMLGGVFRLAWSGNHRAHLARGSRTRRGRPSAGGTDVTDARAGPRPSHLPPATPPTQRQNLGGGSSPPQMRSRPRTSATFGASRCVDALAPREGHKEFGSAPAAPFA